MASIRKRKDNSYQIVVSMGYDADGRKLRETCTYKPIATTPAKIEKEVKAYAHEFEKRILEGESMDAERITFEKFSRTWREEWAETHLTKSTIESYTANLKKHILPRIGHMKLAKITPLHIQAIYNQMHKDGKAAQTIRRVGVAVSRVFDYAYRMGILRENPSWRCEFPKGQRDEGLHYFNQEETNRFFNALAMEYSFETKGFHRRNVNTGEPEAVGGYTEKRKIPYQFRLWFTLAIYGGFRRGELCALRWSDVDFENRIIRIERAAAKVKGGVVIKEPKTKAGIRKVNLPDVCFDMLRTWKKSQQQIALKLGTAWKGQRGSSYDENYIFIQDDGLMMDLDAPRHRFVRIIENYNKACEKPEDRLPMIRLHDLRHTSATLLIASGMDIPTVSHRLGHSRASVTLDVYAHAMPQKDETAAEILGDLLTAHA